MSTERVDKIESVVQSLENKVDGLKGDMTSALNKLADNMHELALAINESKFRDENLRQFTEQQYNHLLESQVRLQNTVDDLHNNYKQYVKENDKVVNEVRTQLALNTDHVKKVNGLLMKAATTVIGLVVVGALTAYFVK